ncbi:ITA2B protein, partial [Pardalotus punctatus]|nr:ITA2B protein [Pardalotus punctatus]
AGHRRDDLLVGAPLYMARRPDGQRSELGRLYLYLGRGQQPLAGPPQTLTGTHPYGRFAATIASLGDLDKDGFGGNTAAGWGGGCATPAEPRLGETEAEELGWVLTSLLSPDVAVGAPQGGDSGSGQVFIFRGQSEGLAPVATQRLDSPFAGPAAFGFALRGATDLDGNGYTVSARPCGGPGLLVGSPGTSAMSPCPRGLPVVVTQTQLSVPDGLNPEVLDCVLPDSSVRVRP